VTQAGLAQDMRARIGGFMDVREHAGQGVEALETGGRMWRLGARHWVLEGASAELLEWSAQAPDARVWLAARQFEPPATEQGVQTAALPSVVPGTVSAYVFDETFRPEAAPAIERLASLRCQSSILSGDLPDRVVAAARQLSPSGHVTVAKAHATPQDKLDVIARAQQQGHRVAVVGDGINDAPVLAKSDVSIALDQGAALAQSQADLIVLGGRLLGVPRAVETARHAMRVVKQNLAWAAFYNLACVPLALAGLLPPWLAGLGMAASSLFVVLNALRLGAFRP
jgi:Cu2+-exporting ATPase